METPASAPPAGWYPDPAARGNMRFWNGHAWEDSSLPSTVKKPRGPLDKRVLIIAGVAAALWIIALALPAYQPTFAASDTADPEVTMGYRAFFLGGLFFWLPFGPWVAWYANVFTGVAAGLVLLRRAPVFRMVMACIGVVLAPVALLLDEMLVDEGGSNFYAVRPGAGLWLWLASIIVLAVASGLALRRTPNGH